MAEKVVTLKIKVDGQELDVATMSAEQFEKTILDVQSKLSTLKVGSDEWKKLTSELDAAQKAFEQTKNQANNTDGKFKSLRTQIRETTVALQKLADEGKEGTSEFKALSDKLDDLGDAQKRVAFQSGQFEDKVAALPGPLGKLGQGVKSVKESFDTFGKGLTISLGIIGLLVTAFFAIKDALGKTKEGTQLLSQATTAFNKVLAPLFAILEKIGTIVLPIVIKGFEMLGSVVGKVADFFGVKTEKVNEITASLEENNEAANKLNEKEKERLEQEKQRQEERTRNLKEQAERRKQIIQEAEKIMNDARLALMTEKDREIEIAAQKHRDNLKKLKAAGNQKLEIEEERYNREILSITEKYTRLIEAEYDNRFKVMSDIINTYVDAQKSYLTSQMEELRAVNNLTLEEEIDFNKQFQMLEQKRLDVSQVARKDELDKEVRLQRDLFKARKASQKEIDEYEEEARNNYDLLERAFVREKLNLTSEFELKNLEIIKKAAYEGKKVQFDIIQSTINDLDKLSAARDFDFDEDIQRNILKIEEIKKQQAIEEEMARGQADVLFKIKRDYGDKINAIEVENTKIKFAEEQRRYQIGVIYANAAAQVGQILQQIAGERKELALLGLAIEKAAAIASIGINAAKNFIADGGIKSPLAWANLTASVVQAAAVGASYFLGVAAIKRAGTTTSGTSGGGTGGGTSGDPYNGLGRNYGDGGMIEGPLHAQGGVMINAEGGEAVMTRGAVTMFAPLLSAMNQMGGGTSFSRAAVGQSSSDNPKVSNSTLQPQIIKTYVVSNDMTSEQQKQARLKDLSTL